MIEKDRAELLSLPFVRLAPFFAAGMLTVYLGGSTFGAVFIAVSSAALICFAIRKSRAVLCAAGAVIGALLMTVYTALYIGPVLEYAGETLSDVRIFVRDVISSSGQSEELLAKIKLNGRTVKLRLSGAEAIPEDHYAGVTIVIDPSSADITAKDLANGILLTGEITEIHSVEYAGVDAYSVLRMVRGGFYGAFAENVFGESAELASAMLFGEDDKLSPARSEYLRVSGAAHYTAVSGAHFAVFAAVLLSMISIERRRTRLLFSLMFAPLVLLFFGVSPSVLRASAMFFLYALGTILRRRSDPLNSLCIAVIVISMISPLAVADAGFGMSVLGVFGVAVVGPAFSEKLCELVPDKAKPALSPLVNVLSCSLCAVICTAPVSAALFGSVSLLGIITSLLFVPFMTAAMMFTLLLGATRIPLFAVPVDWSMKAAAFIVKLFGKCRGLTLPLGFKGAWVLAALLALSVTVCAFVDMKTFVTAVRVSGALAIVIPVVSLILAANRHEVRFVGNSYSSAAIVFNGGTASVFIAGGGDGLAESISQSLRKYGALRITVLAAYDVNYGGSLAIRELSEMLPIDELRANGLAKGMLPGLNVVTVTEHSEVFLEDSVTIAASDHYALEADILLYTGQPKAAEGFDGTAVYFTKKEDAELPDNYRNARTDRDLCVKLE